MPTPRTINLSRLPQADKAALWARLCTQHPALAAWCKDPCVQALKAAFDGELVVTLPESGP